MADDPKLIEAVARAIAETDAVHFWDELPEEYYRGSEYGKKDYRTMARAALAAINASGTHWVAPHEPTEEIIDAYAEHEPEEFAKAATENRKRYLEFLDRHPNEKLPRDKYDKPAAAISQTFPGVWSAMRTAYLAKTETTK